VGFSPSGPVKANRGARARVPAAGKVLEWDDQRTLSPLSLSLSLFIRKEMQTIKNIKNSKTRNYTKQADRQMVW